MRKHRLRIVLMSLLSGVILLPTAVLAQSPEDGSASAPATETAISPAISESDNTAKDIPFSKLDLNSYPKKGDKDDFLTPETAPDSLAILPPPPSPESTAFKADVAAYQAGLKLRKTPLGELAQTDAKLTPEDLGKAFSSVIGIEISPQTTPITYNLMYRMVGDLSDEAVDKAKAHYMRVRPFMHFKARSCQSASDEERMRKNGSYPSGHTAFGWGMALILAEIMPEKQNEIIKRGFEYGQSRVICGAHWQSDVDAGRIMGAAAVARLHTIPAFVRQLNAAKNELAAITERQKTLH